MSFLETPRFPLCPNYGYTASPQYSVTISQTASGIENRNRNWQRALNIYGIQIGPRREVEIQELLEFWHAMGGTECGFRFKDYADYKSCRVNESVSATDQVLVLDTSSAGGYQLIKTYQYGTRQQVRKIIKPVIDTVIIADNGVPKTEGADWEMDYTSGYLMIDFTPVGQITAGFEFDVPVRFDSEFPVEIVNYRAEQVQFQLREVRNPVLEDES
jgi:uncharacterized protein (TIGR02217 family)